MAGVDPGPVNCELELHHELFRLRRSLQMSLPLVLDENSDR